MTIMSAELPPRLDADALRRRVDARLSQADVEAFRRDGAIVIRQLLDADELALLRDGIEANLAQPSPRAKIASRPDDPGRFFEDFCNWQSIGPYRDFIHRTPLALLAQRLMGTRQVRLYHDHLLVKEPGTRQRTAWHQDQPYYNIEGQQNVSMWIPVDPVSRDATLEFIAGSHRGPWLMPRSFLSNEARWFPEGSLQELPDIESDRSRHPIVGWAIEPGDFVCFHMLTLHAAGGVEGGRRRRVFSLRFLGDDITHAPRRWVTSPPFEGLERELPAGARMDHPLFPLLIA
ncbi:MAG: phytanoyl-CoA dioxygenase family protein [Burkholderiaceae bacterium]